MRRARRIDVWDEDGTLGIDAMFRDSGWDPDGREVVVHEYQTARPGRPGDGDAALGHRRAPRPALRRMSRSGAERVVDGRHRAAGDAHRGAGPTPEATDCCTHLNDGLRSLAEVPVLAAALPG